MSDETIFEQGGLEVERTDDGILFGIEGNDSHPYQLTVLKDAEVKELVSVLAPKSAYVHQIQELMVLPKGATLDENFDIEARHWALIVQWRGIYNPQSMRGGYAVVNGIKHLSRAGNWGYPRPFQQWQYRWENMDEAIAMAEKVIDALVVNGRTYEQYLEWRAKNPLGG